MQVHDIPAVDDLIARQRSGFTLEQPFYRDPGIFRRDMERVVSRSWLYVAHESEIPSRGDYLVYQIGEESIILVRGRDHEIRAFFNVCRHRGSHICLEERGNAGKLVCPYHAWTYDLDGRLIAARSMPQGFDKADYPLHGCAVRVAQGLIFICLAGAEDPHVADFSGIADLLESYAGLHHLKDTKDRAPRGLSDLRQLETRRRQFPRVLSLLTGTPRVHHGQRLREGARSRSRDLPSGG